MTAKLRKSVASSNAAAAANTDDLVGPVSAVPLSGSRLLQQALNPSANWNKEDLLNVLFWLRLIVSVALGLVWGALPMLGATGHVCYLAVSTLVLYVYYSRFLGLDDRDFDGPFGLLTEGFMPCYGAFMLLWITVFNLLHAEGGLLYSA